MNTCVILELVILQGAGVWQGKTRPLVKKCPRCTERRVIWSWSTEQGPGQGTARRWHSGRVCWHWDLYHHLLVSWRTAELAMRPGDGGSVGPSSQHQPCSSRAHAGPQQCYGASWGWRRDTLWWLSTCWCQPISKYLTAVLHQCHHAISQHCWAALLSTLLPFLCHLHAWLQTGLNVH